ncbi:hypothetical protein KIN20_009509 [Parelaphostrongylus tenuis]|uniref:Uncharacterized protein n=1 Tax=Parelaphostrongylus tenuis TaxID=148309 RepID=A0AAD5M9L9_PARTN|nr:hypothetical protein KIN20_009509 [Parelaphostrongylus tenuis]
MGTVEKKKSTSDSKTPRRGKTAKGKATPQAVSQSKTPKTSAKKPQGATPKQTNNGKNAEAAQSAVRPLKKDNLEAFTVQSNVTAYIHAAKTTNLPPPAKGE